MSLKNQELATNTELTARYFANIKSDPLKLLMFMRKLPKGGELHNHLWGASYPEDMIHNALKDDLALNSDNMEVYKADKKTAAEDKLTEVVADPNRYASLLKAWSLKDFVETPEKSGHNHFFATFLKNGMAYEPHEPEALYDYVNDAIAENLDYVELMLITGMIQCVEFSDKVTWAGDLNQTYKALQKAGLDKLSDEISTQVDSIYDRYEALCQQNKLTEKPTVRFQIGAIRSFEPAAVFAQLIAGFEVATKNDHVVAINMLNAEDDRVSVRDYKLHMQMVAFLRDMYPSVRVALHAGELAAGSVSPKEMRFHIHDAVIVAKTDRIGHGVAIAHETKAEEVLKYMSENEIAVEINLTSNEKILGVKGHVHPLKLYLEYGVPVCLSTDDAGVLRTTISEEFVKAVMRYDLDYLTIKQMIRNSLTYSFLQGQSIWQDSELLVSQQVCDLDVMGAPNPNGSCQQFLTDNEKASFQWELERKLHEFEKTVALKMRDGVIV